MGPTASGATNTVLAAGHHSAGVMLLTSYRTSLCNKTTLLDEHGGSDSPFRQQIDHFIFIWVCFKHPVYFSLDYFQQSFSFSLLASFLFLFTSRSHFVSVSILATEQSFFLHSSFGSHSRR